MAEGALSYRIELDSADAEQALSRLNGTVLGLSSAFQSMASAVSSGGLGQLTLIAETAAVAVVGLTGALFGLAKSSAAAVDELGEMAAQVGSTVEEMSTLQAALGQFEANTATLQRAFERMGNTIQEMWPGIQKSIADAADKVVDDQIKVERATLNLAKAQLEAENSSNVLRQAYLSIQQAILGVQQAHERLRGSTQEAERNFLALQQAILSQEEAYKAVARASDDAATQQINDQLGIAGAQQSVRNAEIALMQARGITVSAETLRANKIENAQLALINARQRASEAQTTADRNQEDSARKREAIELRAQSAEQAVADAERRRDNEGRERRAILLQLKQAELALSESRNKAAQAELQSQANLLAVQEAQIRLTEAQNKQRENEANSIDKLKAHIDAFAQGTSQGITGVNATVENMIRGLVASVGPGVTALEGIGGSFEEASQKAPALRTVLLKLADVFKNMEDRALAMAFATRLFGRKDAKDMLESLSEGSAAIKFQEEQWRALGLEIPKVAEIISKEFIRSQNLLGRVIPAISTQLGLLFQPMFTDLLDSMSGALIRNRANIISWGVTVRETIRPVIDTFARVFAGRPLAGTDDWLVRTINSIKLFGKAVQAVFGGVVMPIFRGLMFMLDGIALAFNTVFGTNINALGVVVTAVFLRIGVAFAGMIFAMGPVGLAILAISLAVGLLITYWPELSAAAVTAWNWIITKAAEARAWIVAVVMTAPADAWQWIKDTFWAVVSWIGTKAAEVAAWIVAWATTAPSDAWVWIKDTFWAAVEWVLQKGAEARAWIWTWVTEFPANAWQWIKETFWAAVEWVRTQATELKDFVWKAVTDAPANAWQWIVDTFKAQMAKIFGGGSPAGAGSPAGGASGNAAGGLLGGRGTGTSDSNLAWVSRGEYIMPARAVQQPGVLAFLESLRRSGDLRRVLAGMGRFASGGLVPAFADGGQASGRSGLGLDRLIERLKQIMNIVAGAVQTMYDQTQEVMSGLVRTIKTMWSNFKAMDEKTASAVDIIQDLISQAEKAKPKAGGGLLGGRGTGTSDSNLAWVSRGEYITPAHAVRQPGVLAFLEALRRSGGNLRNVLAGMGHFALGGMVRAPISIQAFAGGGMSNVTIQFPGLPEITGLRASSDVVGELRKAAALAQVRSGGRKPSRYS